MSGLGAFLGGAANGAMQAKQFESAGQSMDMKKKMATEQPGTETQAGLPANKPETSDWQFIRSLFGSGS